VDRRPTFSKTEHFTAVRVKVNKRRLQDPLCRVDGFLRGGLQFYAVEVCEDLLWASVDFPKNISCELLSFPVQNTDRYLALGVVLLLSLKSHS
jgi:hypothetical protein